MPFSQNQIRDHNIATVIAAASVGRPNEVAYIAALNKHFYYVIDAAAIADGTTIVTASGVNAFWKVVGDILLQNNFAAILAPTTTADSAAGYAAGSQWVDTVANQAYICVSATATAAVWHMIDSVIDVLDNSTAIAAPTATDDSVAGYSVGSTWIDTATKEIYVCVDATATAAVWNNTSGADNPLASGYNNVSIAATVLAGAAITSTVALGASALLFNGSKVKVLLNGIEQIKGIDTTWLTATTLSLTTNVYLGDTVTVIA